MLRCALNYFIKLILCSFNLYKNKLQLFLKFLKKHEVYYILYDAILSSIQSQKNRNTLLTLSFNVNHNILLKSLEPKIFIYL